MSKIAEQKALEAYPILFSERNGHDNSFKDRRESYIKGYDQAMKDFLEKAIEWILCHFTDSRYCNTHTEEEIKEQFKNYMDKE